MYNTLKFFHIVSVIVWIGGLIMLMVLNRRLAKTAPPEVVRALGQQSGALSMTFFLPAVLLTVITGIGLVQIGRLGFSQTWILWGIIGAVVSFIVGGVLTGGTARMLAMQIARGEVDAAQAAAVQRRIMMFVMLNLLVLLSIVWAMVFKPN